MTKPIIPIKASTQSFTEIEEINHDLVMFVNGSCALVVVTSAVNFGLLSEKEQESMIYAYASLLNSLSFPVQILVRSQHKDVTVYLQLLEEQEKKQTNPKIVKTISSYRKFVAETVKAKDVLDKNFYLILPFSNLELGPSVGVLLGNKKTGLPAPKSQIWEKAQTILIPRRDHLLRLLARVGLKGHQLSTEQLIKLFFSVYNPDARQPEPLTISQLKLKK